MPKPELYLIIALLVSVMGSCSGYTLNKCCPENQQLSSDIQTCIDYIPETYYNITNNTELESLTIDEPDLLNSTNLPWWFPQEVDIFAEDTFTKVYPNVSFFRGSFPLQVKAGEGLHCSFQSTRIITDKEYFAFLDNGHLLLHDDNYDSKNTTYPSLSYCVDKLHVYSNQTNHVIKLCSCLTQVCIKKCCSPERILKKGPIGEVISKCVVPETNVTIDEWRPEIQMPNSTTNNETDLTPIIGFPKCKTNQSTLLLNAMDDQNPYTFYIMNNSNVHIEKLGNTSSIIKYTEYCADIVEYELGLRMNNLVYCTDMPVIEIRSSGIFYGFFVIIGAVFLLATLIVSAILPELRNLHGKNLMAHTASFLVAYIALAATHLNPSMPDNVCIAIGFIIQFSVLAAFFWLNAMCIDISWTFSGLRPPQGNANVRDHKKFMYYSCYAWGSSSLISIATAIVEFTPGPHILRPGFGKRSCLFNGAVPAMVYFYIPMALLLITNLGLFLYTAAKILAVNRETRAVLHKPGSAAYNSDRQRLILYLKLFLLMGVTWVTEIISFAVGGPNEYWYLTDTINMLRGFFIFVLFCCKRSVYDSFKRRYNKSLQGFSMKSQREENSRATNERTVRPSETNMTFTNAQITAVTNDEEV